MSILSLIFLFMIFLSLQWKTSTSQTWIKAGYWYAGSENPMPNINSALFTHLICAFAYIDPSTHELVLKASDEPYISSFSSSVRKGNPSVKPLLSIWTQNGKFGNVGNSSNFLVMTQTPTYRKTFIESSIKMARAYGFEGLDLYVATLLNTKGNMTSLGNLFNEWRVAADQEKLILTVGVRYSPDLDSMSYPVDSVSKNFDWVHIRSYDYHTPMTDNFTGAHSALYDPSSHMNTDYGVNEWIKSGLPASKLVLGLAYHGYAWTLVDPKDNSIGGAPAKGPAITPDGSISYDYIRNHMRSYKINSLYNSTYVINYCTIYSFWIGFDDVEAIKNKVVYAKKMGLRGYSVWQLPNDHNWELSKAAAQEDNYRGHHKRIFVIALCTTAFFILLIGCIISNMRKRIISKVKQVMVMMMTLMNSGKSSYHNQQVISFADIREATNSFSEENKLGEGGYGPVYKVLSSSVYKY
ncbi:class V chitinase-like [Bidens hawaiensis]|uniref:class V chitinase-like n=1 Tax=Bidens hawaiensis TaxID=980011 RepID=UPI00404A5816